MFKKILNFIGFRQKDLSEELFMRLPLRVLQTSGGKKDLEVLLQKNNLYIEKSRRLLPFNKNEFDLWVLPIIEYIGKYNLFLPASYDHHHRDSGGAFEHALQTAVKAVSLLNKHDEIYRKIDSEFRHEYKDAIPLAVFVLALIHDTGKPLNDFIVRACDREANVNYDIDIWQASQETLFDWVNRNSVKYYKAFYDTNRIHKEHEYYTNNALTAINDLINSYVKPELLKKQIDKIYNKENTATYNLLNHIIKAADSSSTRFYMETYGREPRDNCNSAMFFEGLQSFYFTTDRSKKGFFSEPYFWTNNGLHIHYPNGLNAIYEAIVGLGKHLSNSQESPADSLVSILHNTNHLLLVGDRSPKHCAIHSIYVEDTGINADGHEHKFWASASVITIKQPHLLKLLEDECVYRSSYENPSEFHEIPLCARGLNEDPLGYYESLTSTSIEPKSVKKPIEGESQENNQDNDIHSEIVENNSFVTGQEPVEQDILDHSSSKGIRDHKPLGNTLQKGLEISDKGLRRNINQGAIDKIANINIRPKVQEGLKKKEKSVADPNKIKKAAIEMLNLNKSNDEISNHSPSKESTQEIETSPHSNKSKQSDLGGLHTSVKNEQHELILKTEEDVHSSASMTSEKNKRKKNNKKISDLIRKNEFSNTDECDFVINIFLRLSYLITQKIIDINNSEIVKVDKNKIILAKSFLKSSHFNLAVQSFIVEAYLYKGEYPVEQVLRNGYLIDENLSKLIIGNQRG
ncbi:MAG: hypothetical protein ACI92O_000517 [Colwellia sp.]|jgi:hypothetical protein